MKNYSELLNNYSELLKDGFTGRMATNLIQVIDKERKSGKYTDEVIQKAIQSGFTPSGYTYLKDFHPDLENHLDLFVNDYDFYRFWPQCGWSRIWVNDKLTLKYILYGTAYAGVMPDYYFYSAAEGLKTLCDNPYRDNTFDGFVTLLKEKRIFACKPNNGSLSIGFNKLEYNGHFLINNKTVSENELKEFVSKNVNFIYTEFLYPHKDLAVISSKVPTIRLIVINSNGNNPYIVPSAYIRFGLESEIANYIAEPADDDFSIFCNLNVQTGEFNQGSAFYTNTVKPLDFHPDTNAPLNGFIPNWDNVVKTVLGISKHLFNLEWTGYDLCLDRNGKVRLMEINTMPGFDYIQCYRPLKSDPITKQYFDSLTEKIDSLSENEAIERNRISR